MLYLPNTDTNTTLHLGVLVFIGVSRLVGGALVSISSSFQVVYPLSSIENPVSLSSPSYGCRLDRQGEGDVLISLGRLRTRPVRCFRYHS